MRTYLNSVIKRRMTDLEYIAMLEASISSIHENVQIFLNAMNEAIYSKQNLPAIAKAFNDNCDKLQYIEDNSSQGI